MSDRRPQESTTLNAPENTSFEELVSRLEDVVRKLESSDLPLEAAIATYQQGVALAQEGHARLTLAERTIEELTRGNQTKPADVDALLASRTDTEAPEPNEAER
ncbi:MAG: exodeoxyribonuclease VII small subunit [Deltaproteobacteria bacterium]|nr:exodeoxyribonuclease VII small subunit [Deltaproteobacteria bacterium]